jgi:hypothetical protein
MMVAEKNAELVDDPFYRAFIVAVRPLESLAVPNLITSTVKEPAAALDGSIQAKDGYQFAAAYNPNVRHRSSRSRRTALNEPIVIYHLY